MANSMPRLHDARGGNSAVEAQGDCPVTIADLCLILGVLFAFATLVLKVIEVSRK